jgi:alkylation response protein AidB-like acyl-CoA dehydrogenase
MSLLTEPRAGRRASAGHHPAPARGTRHGSELRASTPEGARLVDLAEQVAAELASRANEHDQEATYPFEGIETLRRARYFAAPIPADLGGLGVESVHDVVVAASRLARGDASVAIGVNMHFAALLNIVRRYSVALGSGKERRAAAFAQSMREIATGDVIMAAAISEIGQDITRPGTTATRTETGWTVNGRKVFCTMSPAATVLYTSVRFESETGEELYGYAMIPVSTPGVTVNDDWDAMGMRASGSHSVTLDAVELPEAALRGGFRVGEVVAYMERNLYAGTLHASASLGIAESAHAEALARSRRASNGVAAHLQMLTAANELDLCAARATLSRATRLIDEHAAAHPGDMGSDEEIVALFTEAQTAKAFVNEASSRIADRALTMSGGSGYINGSPLARAARDVRAGAFMHPLGANRAYELIASVAHGRVPELH